MKKTQPFLIGVAGGISSGKSTVCKKIIDELTQLNIKHKKKIVIISLDSFYKPLSDEQLAKAERGEYNLDHPDSFDDELAYATLSDIIEGKKAIDLPIYDNKSYNFITGSKIHFTPDTKPDVVILEGILVFYYPKLRDMCQLRLFVDCDADTRLSRRVMRDLSDYDRPLEQVLEYYQKYVKPTFEEFCLPTKKYADVIIPRGAENTVAINLIVQHINDFLNNSNSHQHAANNSNNNNSNSHASPSNENCLLHLNNNHNSGGGGSAKNSPSSNHSSSSSKRSLNMSRSPLSVSVQQQQSHSPTPGEMTSGPLSGGSSSSKKSETLRPH